MFPESLVRRLPPPLQRRDFSLLAVSSLTMSLATEMTAVAVGWQVFDLERNPLHLGLIGLAEFLPLPLLALPAGHIADRFPRRIVSAIALALALVVTAGLLAVSILDVGSLWPYFALALLSGVSVALGAPASRALAPELVPAEMLASALALRSVAWQAAVVGGPALGGLLFAIRPELAYGTAVVLLGVSLATVLAIRSPAAEDQLPVHEVEGLRGLLAGIAFLRRSPVVLGAITLDLFAVLLGGAVALLPVFARDILEVGPVGLGVLRSAPALGALVAGVILARRPLGGHAGRKLLLAVAAFGVSMVVFGLSRSVVLSFAALAVSGFVDMFSVNIRATMVALATPNELRGRVNAVEMVFISASNELGAFESGLAASIFGTVAAVVGGGCVTIALALSWAKVFPVMARIDRLEDLTPASATPAGAG
jgi:MFS family permease